jgi:methionyl aminopeptidase
MIIIKKPFEIELMREGGKIGAEVLEELIRMVKPGLSTIDLDKKTNDLLAKYHARPAFKNYAPFDNRKKYPASLCVSINEEVVHGVPSSRKIAEGDIISLDLGVFYKGYYTDMASTTWVGKITELEKKLIEVTKKSLDITISEIKSGVHLGDISATIQKIIEKNNFSVIRDCVGHGIGKLIHEEPSIPNFGRSGTGVLLKEGMTLAIEPMASLGDYEIQVKEDEWAITTLDASKAAHFEHTIAVSKGGCQVLTSISGN